MRYITLSELSVTIRNNIYKIPHNIDFIIGIPRSGMIVASIISEFLNVPLIDINSFCEGVKPSGGRRLGLVNESKYNRVLVVDDTCYSGNAIREAKAKLKDYKQEFIYLAAYLEGWAEKELDIYLEDIRKDVDPVCHLVIYEWNVFNHHPHIMSKCLYDIDGLICLDPPNDFFTEQYEAYIKNATPLYIPKVKIRGFVTYRIEKYRDITAQWLASQGITYDKLIMFNAQSREERNSSGVSPEQMKAAVYKADEGAMLFVESDDWQAQRICQMTKKPVLCTKSNKLYQ